MQAPRQLLAKSVTSPRTSHLWPQSLHRSFTTSSPRGSLNSKKGGDIGSHLPKYIIHNPKRQWRTDVPDYPLGESRLFKQMNKGLYGGQMIQFGNHVSRGKKEEWVTKARRTWHPNVFTHRLWSKALNRFVQIRVTARVYKTIDKVGGLDEYLLGEKEARIRGLGESGWFLRWAIMQTTAVKKRFAAQMFRSLWKRRIAYAKEKKSANPPAIFVLDICAVDPEFQRRGIAGKLVEWGLEEAKRRGGLECTTEGSSMGRGVYVRLGFKDEGVGDIEAGLFEKVGGETHEGGATEGLHKPCDGSDFGTTQIGALEAVQVRCT